MPGIKEIWGAAGIGSGNFETPESIEEILKALKDGGIDTLDTATLYGPSEAALSKAGAHERFTIDTKSIGGFMGNVSNKENVIAHGTASQEFFKQVDIWYLHSPDEHTPIEQTLEGVNEMYKRGFFKRFGLSNFKPEAVQKVYDHCKAKGYPLPAVYQGNYNAAARKAEEEIIPLIRKLGMSFYAYSPIAGGFLTKSKEDIESGKGRFDPGTMLGKMYSGLYAKPALLEALSEWDSIAQDEGIGRAELAYRWAKWNSALNVEHGDGLIIGSSSVSQLNQTLEYLKKGPLSDKAVKRIDHFWETVKHAAPLDNLHG